MNPDTKRRAIPAILFALAFFLVVIAARMFPSRSFEPKVAASDLRDVISSPGAYGRFDIQNPAKSRLELSRSRGFAIIDVPAEPFAPNVGSTFKIPPGFDESALKWLFERLSYNGFIAVTRWEYVNAHDALRMTATLAKALKDLGTQDISNHFMIVSEGFLDRDGRAVLILASRERIPREIEQRAFDYIEHHPEIALIYSPHYRAEAAGIHPVDPNIRWNPFSALMVSNDPEGFADKYQANIAPVTRYRPFYYFTLKLSQIFHRSVFQPPIDWSQQKTIIALALISAAGLALLIGAIFAAPRPRVPGVFLAIRCAAVSIFGIAALAFLLVVKLPPTFATLIVLLAIFIGSFVAADSSIESLLYSVGVSVGSAAFGAVFGLWFALEFGVAAAIVASIVVFSAAILLGQRQTRPVPARN